jgi:hypothetical protein
MSVSCLYSASVLVSVNIPPVTAAASAGITTSAAKWWSVVERKQCPLENSSAVRSGKRGYQVTEPPLRNHCRGKFRSDEVPPEKKSDNAKALHIAEIALLLKVCSSRHSHLLNYVGWQISERVRNTGGTILTGENKTI